MTEKEATRQFRALSGTGCDDNSKLELTLTEQRRSAAPDSAHRTRRPERSCDTASASRADARIHRFPGALIATTVLMRILEPKFCLAVSPA